MCVFGGVLMEQKKLVHNHGAVAVPGVWSSEAQHPFVSSRDSEAYRIMGAENKTEQDFCSHLAFLSKNPNWSGLSSTRLSKKEGEKKRTSAGLIFF